ncbi:MAG: sugar transferase [Planctomycetota bacterium]
MSRRRIDYAAFFLNLLQVFVDLSACLIGFAVSFYIYRDTEWLQQIKSLTNVQHTPTGEDYYLIAAAFTVLLLITFAVKHLYQSRDTGLMNMDEASSVLQGLFFTAAVVICGVYVLVDQKNTRVSRLIVGMSVFASCCGVLAGRAAIFKARRYLQTRGHFFRRVVICGADDAGRIIARKLLHSPKFHLLPVAFLDDNPARQNTRIECLSEYESLPVAGTLAQIGEAISKYAAHEIWIAMPNADQQLFVQIAQAASDVGVPCRLIPNLYQIPLETLHIDLLAGVPLLSIKPRATARPIPFTKRAFDIVFALAVLIASVPLLWWWVIWAIKFTSPGSAFFAQQRIGQGGRPFNMYKFRTMYMDAPAYATTPNSSRDHRITPIGRWLRKLSFDELPQFWNVLKGDMSVVGPRPEMPQIVAQYNAIQQQRLSVKPGITGIWQISADRKNPIHENIDYDLYYIENQSFFLDLTIILTTGFYSARGI